MRKPTLVIACLAVALALAGRVRAQTTFGGNVQHTADYSATAQNLNAVHWTTSIDQNNTGGFAHYGAPLITPANTIFVPVKTGATGGFEINVFNAASGGAIYSLTTDYTQPSHNWILPYQPVLATSSETRLYYPGNGGTIYYIDNVDSASHGAPVQQVFYTTLARRRATSLHWCVCSSRLSPLRIDCLPTPGTPYSPDWIEYATSATSSAMALATT